MAQNTLTDIPTIATDKYIKLLQHSISTGGNMLVFGQAGIGKTEIAKSVAEKMGYEVVYLNLSVLQPPDLVGLPIIDDDSRVVYATPKFLPKSNNSPDEQRNVVLLVDELDKADSDLQNPMLELFQFRSVNGTPLRVHSIVATANLPDEGAFSKPISHALTNRCMVYKLNVDFDTWIEWAASVSLNPVITGFLVKNKSYLSKPSCKEDPTAYCSPSPRSWGKAAVNLDAIQASKQFDSIFAQEVVSGCVGAQAAIDLRIWIDYYKDLAPTIDGYLNGTIKLKEVCIKEIDKIFVFTNVITQRLYQEAYKKTQNAESKKAINLCLDWIETVTPEIRTSALRTYYQHNDEDVKKLLKIERLSNYIQSIYASKIKNKK